ncbi:unnamed protein product [Mytilus coruscus]|uniref:Uncharacterized protein n=1 Tax=Mytilus coruscus TaxID=42192 RepID=A0A6J8DFR1_MYTCO|nr:unnamed protein product [Mytilus coruscus]
MCIGQNYSIEIQDEIRILKERTLSPVEYTDSLLKIYQWKLTQDESTSKVLKLLTTMQLENITRDERIDCMEFRIINAIRNQRSTENPDHSGRVTRNQPSPESEDNSGTVVRNQRPAEDNENKETCRLVLEETQCKTVDQSNHVSRLDEDDVKYFKLFSEVKQLRENGNADANDGMLYSLLVYVVLYGSSTEKKIDIEILLTIHNSIYKRTFPSETVSVKTCLAALVPKYLDKVEEKFTPCSITVVKAVIHCFGNECSECFVQNCSLYILLDYVVPIGTNIEDFHVEIDACLLTSVLVQRIKSNADARSVGEYIYKLAITHHNVETANLLIDTLEQSNEQFTPDHMIHLLDGLTKLGENFSIFKKLGKLYNVFCRHIDELGNTVFHFLVTRFSESRRFNAYIKFFCESNIVVMQLENNYNQTPIDFASYQGRYDVIANIMGNIENTEGLIARILTMVNEGVDLLKRMNLSKSKLTSDLYIGIETFPLGGIHDYENILDIIGIRKKVRKHVCDVDGKKEENILHKEGKAGTPSSSTEELSKTVGDGILGLVTEIKMGLSAITKIPKGLSAITKIPKLIKAIHQATNIEDDD